ncbi:hypothetical protein M758_9G181600 [Ceratodon purpureus]|nr:hypothetical protein M758_9G181600 [Ceratodon purpureus]
MFDSEVRTSIWLLGTIMMLSCVSAGKSPGFTIDSAKIGVSEAYSHDDTSTTLYSSDNYLKCTSDQQVTVNSTQDLSDLIKLYTSSKKPVKIRATRRGFHSSMGFVCSGKRGSSYAEYHKVIDNHVITSITVLLHLMNRIVTVDCEHHQLTVEAGMTLRELTLAAEANHMSVLAGSLPVYANLTVGGVIMASAHGTGYRRSSSVGDLVRKVKWVNGKGEIIVSDLQTKHGAKEVRALVGGLGLLGIVTEVTLQLQPYSRSIVEVRKDLKDKNIVDDLKKMIKHETPAVIAFWRPDFGTYKSVLWTQVNESEYSAAKMPKFYPNGSIELFTAVDDHLANTVKEVMAAWENDAKDESPSANVLNADVCSLSMAIQNTSVFQDGTGSFIDHATLPTNYAMISADCAPKCLFDVHHMGVFFEDTEFTIKLSQFEDWANDVKKVVKTELTEANTRLANRYGEGKVKRCMSPGYFWIRFGQGNQNLLSTTTGLDDFVHVQWSTAHSAFTPNKLSKISTIVETIEQLTLCKYKGRPHWGKNHERVVRHPKCKVRDNFPAENIAKLLEMQHEHDPEKIFEPELFRRLLQRSGPEYCPLCTPHYSCYCAHDSHCPPGFRCRASASFAEYKICRLVESHGHRKP